jgi:type IV secretory pathway TraG/TraD family ATPase VirD4
VSHDFKFWAMTHGWPGFLLAYAFVVFLEIVALIRLRASPWKLFETPVFGLVMTVFAYIVIAVESLLLHLIGVTSDGVVQLILAVATLALLGYSAGGGIAFPSSSVGSYRRGAVVSDEGPTFSRHRSRRLRGNERRTSDPNSPVTLAGWRVAAADETKHFKFIGTTGTGKSTAIREMLSAALARGDRAVIADPDGGYLSHFYDADRGDVVLNPFDPDSVKWNLLGEIRNVYDVDQLARSLIPDGGSDRSWSEYARTFFTAVTQQALAARVTDDREIYRLLTKAPTKELKLLLAGTVAGPFLEDANDRMFGSVRSVTSSAVRALRYTTEQQATPFSVRQWIQQGAARLGGGRGGVLFLPYKAGEIAALRSTISAWMRIAIFEAMDRGEGDQRLWFVVDELDALGEIDGLKDALARLRKFGGRCVLGFQSISQVSSTYGKGAADTIVENCGNTLILRCSASEQGGTSQFASRLIGQQEVVHETRSKTYQPGKWMASTTTSEHRSIEPAIMASEIERLPDLVGLLKFASIPDWQWVTLSHVSYPTVVRTRRPDTPASTPEPESAAPAPTLSHTTALPATPFSTVKSRAPIRKRTRKSQAENAQSMGTVREGVEVGNDSDRAKGGQAETLTEIEMVVNTSRKPESGD